MPDAATVFEFGFLYKIREKPLFDYGSNTDNYGARVDVLLDEERRDQGL